MKTTRAVIAAIATTVSLAAAAEPTTYDITLSSTNPPRLTVVARLHVDGHTLEMNTTRPGDIPGIAGNGWPALVTKLTVNDSAGRGLEVKPGGARGWDLLQPVSDILTLTYDIDYAPLAQRGWPAPREAGMTDDRHIVLIGRSIFITSPVAGAAKVTFTLPPGWRAVTAWPAQPDAKDLTENLLAFTRQAPETVTAGGFKLYVVPMGFWEPALGEVRRVMRAVIPKLVALTRTHDRKSYLVILLPVKDDGAESYRSSFALTAPEPPTRATSVDWGTMIAHEIYHQWNGWELVGKDYASSQWFQEGFTVYAADIAMTSSKLVAKADYLDLLAKHVADYRTLTTSLEAPGTRKGAPLYGGGSLVAFTWDTQIREASGGKRSLWDFMQELWKQTGNATQEYEWKDIQAALQATAPSDWTAFHRKHIEGTVPLPLDAAFARAGIRFDPRPDHAGKLELDPAAPESAKTLFERLMAGK